MFKSVYSSIKELIKFLDRHLIWTLLVTGFASYLLGIFFENFELTKFLSEPLKSFSKIIIGAGVFTALTKSSYYATFFQNRVFNVFYQPGKHFSQDELNNKWLTLTQYLIEKNAGKSSRKVSEILSARYLRADMDYHFKNMTITYDIELDTDSNDLVIKQNMEAYIIINNDLTEAELQHKTVTDGSMELLHLMIDDELIQEENNYIAQQEDSNIKILKTTIFNRNVPIKINWCYKTIQNIADEPFILNNYSRYVNGLVVKFKTTNCAPTFRLTGVITAPENKLSLSLDGNGYTHVVIAKQGDLTLPGQGFILVLSKDDMRGE